MVFHYCLKTRNVSCTPTTVVFVLMLCFNKLATTNVLPENIPGNLTAELDKTESPTITGIDGETLKIKEGKNLNYTLPCEASGSPAPTIIWKRKDGKNLADLKVVQYDVANSVGTKFLVFESLNRNHTGTYLCIAENTVDKAEKSVSLSIESAGVSEEENYRGTGHGATVGVVVTAVAMTLLGVGLCTELLRRRNRHGLSKAEIDLFEKGNVSAIQKQGFAHENAMFMPYDTSYEISENKLRINQGDILGAGAYGMVVKGKLEGRSVAVKTAKPGAEKMYLKALLSELKIMIYIGRHNYISELVGACSKNLGRGRLSIVVNYYPLGNIENYLRTRRYMFVNQFDESGYIDITMCKDSNGVEIIELCTKDLVKWSYQIASGMEYLSNRKVIHGDLAARNILLTEDKTAKITDFGLARQLYDYANYVKKHQEPLPWRWMAIESLRELAFSSYSDVWSYGVLLWEMFTCGDIPYPGHSWTVDFVDKLDDGLRLTRPKYATRKLHCEIMENCWQTKPDNRISFLTMKTYFKEMFDTFP